MIIMVHKEMGMYVSSLFMHYASNHYHGIFFIHDELMIMVVMDDWL